jgi:hypothetical protein
VPSLQVRTLYSPTLVEFCILSLGQERGTYIPLNTPLSDCLGHVRPDQLQQGRKVLALTVSGLRLAIRHPPGPLGIIFLEKSNQLELARLELSVQKQSSKQETEDKTARECLTDLCARGMILESVDQMQMTLNSPHELLSHLNDNQSSERRLCFTDALALEQLSDSTSLRNTPTKPFVLHLAVVGASYLEKEFDLLNMRSEFSAIRPYVSVFIDGNFVSNTAVKSNASYVSFDETFNIHTGFLNATLRCEVFDKGRFARDESLGYLEVLLADLPLNDTVEDSFPLKECRGHLRLQMTLVLQPLLNVLPERGPHASRVRNSVGPAAFCDYSYPCR